MKYLGTKRLETERIILRRIEHEDIQEMYEKWASLEICNKYFPWNEVKDMDEYEQKVASWIESYEDKLYYQWILELKEMNEVIGIINLHHIYETSNSAETSYILTPTHWGKGLMKETLKRIIEFAFLELELARLEADVLEGNIASECVLTKCGMTKETVVKAKYQKNGMDIDSVPYTLFKKDWLAMQNNA
jgi:RimJ/RimL family protein N-acetyltransferase